MLYVTPASKAYAPGLTWAGCLYLRSFRRGPAARSGDCPAFGHLRRWPHGLSPAPRAIRKPPDGSRTTECSRRHSCDTLSMLPSPVSSRRWLSSLGWLARRTPPPRPWTTHVLSVPDLEHRAPDRRGRGRPELDGDRGYRPLLVPQQHGVGLRVRDGEPGGGQPRATVRSLPPGRWDYFVRHLLGAAPPPQYEIVRPEG